MFKRNIHKAIPLILLALATPVTALPDPTRPADFVASQVAAEGEQGSLRVQSLLLGKHRRLAVINGQSYSVGDSVGGAKITAINKTGVTVVRQGEKIQLSLQRAPILKKRVEEN